MAANTLPKPHKVGAQSAVLAAKGVTTLNQIVDLWSREMLVWYTEQERTDAAFVQKIIKCFFCVANFV